MQYIKNLTQDFLSNKKALSIAGGALMLLGLAKLYFRGGICRVDRDMSGQIVVITGGSSGLGK